MRRGGFALLALLVLGVLARLGLTGAPSPNLSPAPQGISKKSPARAKSTTSPAEGPFALELRDKIEEFFGRAATDQEAAEREIYWRVPAYARAKISFIVFTAPDPVHSHLSLLFDTSIEALEQGIQDQGYAFDRAVMPWYYTGAKAEEESAAEENKSTPESRERDAYPGLMIFREGESRLLDRQALEEKRGAMTVAPPTAKAAKGCPTGPLDTKFHPDAAPVFVFVVGETPTGGIHKDQFLNAIRIMGEIHGQTDSLDTSEFALIGPTFSGSLFSLDALLTDYMVESKKQAPACSTPSAPRGGPLRIYSGTVMGTASIDWFEKRNAARAIFTRFQENAATALRVVVSYAKSLGYSADRVAIVSEDETAYGSGGSTQTLPSGAGTEPAPLELTFPRGIAQFRAAYEQAASAAASATGGSSPAPANRLKDDLHATGSDDDSVAPYAHAQTPLEQEAEMLGIVSELRRHQSLFVMIRASDALDELFLARYLRQAYSNGRIVVPTPDLLFARENDGVLPGILGVGAYPLAPGVEESLCRVPGTNAAANSERVFGPMSSVGIYNAAIAALANMDEFQVHPDKAASDDGSFLPIPRRAFYSGYGQFVSPAHGSSTEACVNRPDMWLTVLARDGYRPLEANSLCAVGENRSGCDASRPHSTLRSVEPSADSSGATPADAAARAAARLQDQRYGARPQPVPLSTPAVWVVLYLIGLFFMSMYVYFSYKGTILRTQNAMSQFGAYGGPNRPRAFLIAIGALLMMTGQMMLTLPWYEVLASLGLSWEIVPLWLPVPVFVFFIFNDLVGRRRRNQRLAAFVFAGVATCIALAGWLTHANLDPSYIVFWAERSLALTSGVSPVLPLILLFVGGFGWMWFNLQALELADQRHPQLPLATDLPEGFKTLTDLEGNKVLRAAKPFSLNKFIWLPMAVVAALAIVLIAFQVVQFHSVESREYDGLYTALVVVGIYLLLGCLLKMVAVWIECQPILEGLARLEIRQAFRRLKEFSWQVVWNPSSRTLDESYRFLERELQNLERLDRVLESEMVAGRAGDYGLVRSEIAEVNRIMGEIGNMIAAVEANPSEIPQLMEQLRLLQIQLAKTAAVTARNIVVPAWNQLTGPVASREAKRPAEDCDCKKLATEVVELLRTPAPAAPFPPAHVPAAPPAPAAAAPAPFVIPHVVQDLTEEFVAFIYANFLTNVLLRLRGLVMGSIVLYVALVLSTSSYIFEPKTMVTALAFVLLFLGAAAVGFVYAEMHRDEILSRLTSTAPGKLGHDFWVKFLTAGAIPLLSVLASQFPSISRFLFSWLQPALQALK